jgi:hypothetical protein
MHLMELLSNLSPMESRFGPFGDSANLDVGLVHSLSENVQRLGNHIGHIGRNSYVTWVMWNLILVCLHARQVHGLRQKYLRLRNRFGRTRWYSFMTRRN